MKPGEMCFYINDIFPSHTPGLRHRGSFPTIQMIWPRNLPELIAVAFPGLFREQTCRMGSYLGLRSPSGQLIAMAGDRFCLRTSEGIEWREISAVCTHPSFTGQGLATRLLAAKLHEHQRAGVRSFLQPPTTTPAPSPSMSTSASSTTEDSPCSALSATAKPSSYSKPAYLARVTIFLLCSDTLCSGVVPSFTTTSVGGASTTIRVLTLSNPPTRSRCVVL